MYQQIINPETGTSVSITSRTGQGIIARYQRQVTGGAGTGPSNPQLHRRRRMGCHTIARREHCKTPCRWSYQGDIKGYCRDQQEGAVTASPVVVFQTRPPVEMLTDFSQVWTMWQRGNLTDHPDYIRTYAPEITPLPTRIWAAISYTLKWGKVLGPGIFFLVVWGLTSYYSTIVNVVNNLFPSRAFAKQTPPNVLTDVSSMFSEWISGKITNSVLYVYYQIFGKSDLIFGVKPTKWFRAILWTPINEEIQWGIINHALFDVVILRILNRITPKSLDFADRDSKCREIAFILFSLFVNAPYFASQHRWHNSKYLARITMDAIYRKYGATGSVIFHSLWNMFSVLIFNDQIQGNTVRYPVVSTVNTSIQLLGTVNFVHGALAENTNYQRLLVQAKQTFYDKVEFIVGRIYGETPHEHQD